MDSVSVEFTCDCGNTSGWITEGKVSTPCPACGSKYLGVYNKKNCTINCELFFETDKEPVSLKNKKYYFLSLALPFFLFIASAVWKYLKD